MSKPSYKQKLNRVSKRLKMAETSGLTTTEYFDLRSCLEHHASDEQLTILKASIGKWLENRISRYERVAFNKPLKRAKT